MALDEIYRVGKGQGLCLARHMHSLELRWCVSCRKIYDQLWKMIIISLTVGCFLLDN